MKGKVLDFSLADSQGVISGDDGNRYTFVGKEWKSSTPPRAGVRVDYDTNGRTALAVYLDQVPHPNAGNSDYDSFYRSGDDKILAGVCAGLAHKWKVNRTGLRFATFLLAFFFFWILPLVYIVCWIVFPARPTRNVA